MPSIIRSVLAYHTHRDSSEVRASETLYRDLGLTSLGLALAALDVEDILGIQLDPEDLGSMHTVEDLLSATENAIGARHPFILLREVSSAPTHLGPSPSAHGETSLLPLEIGSARTPK